MKKYYFISLSFLVLFLCSSFSAKIIPFGVRVVVIDPGHGGKDPGCHGKNHLEKDVSLAVALKLGNYIQDNLKDVKVIYTRSSDVFVELQERAAIANRAKADLFISIHCNSACARDKKLKKDVCRDHVNGAETFVMGIKNEQGNLAIASRENSAILLEDNYVKKYDGFDPNSAESYIIMSMFADTYLDHSLSFATKVQKQYCQKIGRCDRGVKRASLWVLWRTYMPSVLTEIGYLTNAAEEHFLGSEKGQDYIASGLFRAFREYKDEIEGVTKTYNDAFEKQGPYKISKEDSLQIEENLKKKDTIVVTSPKKEAVLENNKKLQEEKKEEHVNVKPNIVDTVKNNSTKDVKLTDKPAVVTEAKQIKIPLKKDSIKSEVVKNKKTESANPIIYKVQILSSDKKIAFDSPELKDVKMPGEYIDNGVFKYTSGEYLTLEGANKSKDSLKSKGFKDAFVIAVRNGKRIPFK